MQETPQLLDQVAPVFLGFLDGQEPVLDVAEFDLLDVEIKGHPEVGPQGPAFAERGGGYFPGFHPALLPGRLFGQPVGPEMRAPDFPRRSPRGRNPRPGWPGGSVLSSVTASSTVVRRLPMRPVNDGEVRRISQDRRMMGNLLLSCPQVRHLSRSNPCSPGQIP